MIGPRCHQQIAEVLQWQPVGLVAEHLARRFARAADHRQRSWQLAVPGLKDVPSGAAIAELKTIVSSLDHVHHPAGRHGVRVIIYREQPAKDVSAGAERVPEPRGHAAELFAVGSTPENVTALAATGNDCSICTDQLVAGTEVFTHAEVEIALRIEGQPRETVVRIVTLGVEEDKAVIMVRLDVAAG